MDLSNRIYGYLNQISIRDLVERGGHGGDECAKRRAEVGHEVRVEPLRPRTPANV
jgi:hypothetical protein